ncbi:MAG: ABC transporter permease [Candidatus Rokuibacteriota bacterium]|nr:MAG: ABC transporter permease [Candidatus Rokubacteria bacterium]
MRDRVSPLLPLTFVVGGLIAFLSLQPTLMLLWGSFSDAPLGLPGKLTLDHYRTAYSDPETLEMILNSFVFAAGSAFLSIVFAAVIAWVVIRTNAPCRRLLELITVVPNIMPPLLIAVAWTLLLNPSTGVINILVMKVFGLSSAPFNVYSMGGMIFVEGLILTPLAFLIIAAALSSMDPSLEESARMSGSTHLRVVGRVTLPLVRPAILAAATLNFVRAIESFDTPAILALPARLDVFTSKIYKEALDAFPPNHNLAASYAMSLLVITLGLVYVYRLMIRRAERFATVTGKGFRPALIDLGRSRYLAAAIAAGILVLLVVFPFLILLLTSLLPYFPMPLDEALTLLTAKHYATIVSDERVWTAMGNSLFLAVVGATLCMLLASLTAYITVKTTIVGRGIIEGLSFLPFAFPGTALGIGLLWAYVRFPIPVIATIWILLIGYVTRFLPYGLRSMTATIVQIHRELEEASQISGGGFAVTFRKILLPLMKPGFLGGWILLATIFIREFSLSVFLYTPASEPIGPLLYHLWLDGLHGRMAALGVVVTLLSTGLVMVAMRLARPRE